MVPSGLRAGTWVSSRMDTTPDRSQAEAGTWVPPRVTGRTVSVCSQVAMHLDEGDRAMSTAGGSH